MRTCSLGGDIEVVFEADTENTYCRCSSVAFNFLPETISRSDRALNSEKKLSGATYTLHLSLHRSACSRQHVQSKASPHQAWPNPALGPTGWMSSSLRPGDTEDADLGDTTSIILNSAAGHDCLVCLVGKNDRQWKQRACCAPRSSSKRM